MKNFKFRLLFLFLFDLFFISTTLAQYEGRSRVDPTLGCCCDYGFFYFQVETGFSSSRKADISVDLSFWDPAPEGYNNDLKNSELFGVAVGYNVNAAFGMDISVTRRPSFEYEKFQSPESGDVINFLGKKTRFFDFNNTSIMFNGSLYGKGLSNCLNVRCGKCTFIQPFVGGGIGIAYNTVENFHSKLVRDESEAFQRVASILTPKTHTHFAWQGFGGLELVSGKRFSLGAEYRYFDGGKFTSNDYVVDAGPDTGSPIVCPVWKGKFRSNEGVLFLRYAI